MLRVSSHDDSLYGVYVLFEGEQQRIECVRRVADAVPSNLQCPFGRIQISSFAK